MRTLWQDALFAARLLRKSPGFTSAVLITMALGIGANATILSLADAIFLRQLPVPDAGRVVHVYQRRATAGAFPLSYPDYLYYRQHARAFETLAAHYPSSPMHLVVDREPASINGAVATASYFHVLRLRPAAGRFFGAEEDRVRDRDAVAVISDSLWERRYRRDPAAVGRQIHLNGRSFAIVGVAPAGFGGVHHRGIRTDVWIPAAMFGVGYRYCDAFDRGCTIVQLLGRLRPGVSPQEAQRELDVLARQLEAAYPTTSRGVGVSVVAAQGLGYGAAPAEERQIALLLAVVGLVLLIACANIAGLLLARAIRRRKEIAVRLALGASRARLVRQLLTESVMLALVGGSLGLLMAVWGNSLLEALFVRDGAGRPVDFRVALGGWVLAATACVTLLAAVLFGLLPALHASRPSVVSALKSEGAAAGVRRGWLRESLVAGQVAISIVLLIGAGLLVQTMRNLYAGPGFDPGRVVMLRLRPSLVDYSYEKAHAYHREVLRRLEALPGVVSASPAEFLAGFGAGRNALASRESDGGAAGTGVEVTSGRVGPRYFATLGVPLLEGREFADGDRTGRPSVAIVSDVLARRLWPGEPAAGRTLTLDGVPHEVVGVVKDAQYYSEDTVSSAPRPYVYLSYWQPHAGDAFGKDSRTIVRAAGRPDAMMAAIRREAAAVDPSVPMSEDYPLIERVRHQFQQVRLARTMLVGFGVVAAFLSVVGLYGVLALTVGQRTRELAIRVALGAERHDVAGLVLGDGLRVAGIGAGLGLAGAWMSARLLASLLYGVQWNDVTTFVAAPAVLVLAALAASCLPARRAANVSPLVALRYE